MKKILRYLTFLFVALAAGFLACWALSFSSGGETAQFAAGKEPIPIQAAFAKGQLIVCDAFDNREAFDLVDRHVSFEPPVKTDLRRSLLGFNYRRLTYAVGEPTWSFEVSLLAPLSFAVLLAGFCFWAGRKPASAERNVVVPLPS